MVADMQRDEKVGKDARDVQTDKYKDEVMAPFGGEEELQLAPECPDPGLIAVDLHDVAGYEVP